MTSLTEVDSHATCMRQAASAGMFAAARRRRQQLAAAGTLARLDVDVGTAPTTPFALL